MPKRIDYCKLVRSKGVLFSAWRKVRENGAKSKSPETRREIEEFSRRVESEIPKIYKALLYGKFQFLPARGILAERNGKKPRPIVVSPIPNRIVQRAILDVLQRHDKIADLLRVPTSFGGIEERGVSKAIEVAFRAIKDGASFCIRSDINAFFTKIPRQTVIDSIAKLVPDTKFMNLLSAAVATELENMADLREQASEFPIYEIGVAQGCCLSPLMGNLLLNDFDNQLNGRGVTCLRYIDDFIILGTKPENVRKAFESGLGLLAQHGLSAYIPWENKDKAQCGPTCEGLEFLGCEIKNSIIRPTRKSQKSLMGKIDGLIANGQKDISSGRGQKGENYLSTLSEIHFTLKGWGNHYFFCNDRSLWASMDIEIDKKINGFISFCSDRMRKLSDAKAKRRALGVHLLADSNYKPVE